MKTIYIYSLFIIVALSFLACTKKDNKVILENGTAPVLTASKSGTFVFDKEKADSNAVIFTWNNPDYSFNTGTSSHTVNYLLEIDTTGSDFTNPLRSQVAISADLLKSFTVKELNTLLNSMDLDFGVAHQIEFRLRASLMNAAAPLYSNVIKMTITPYLDVAVPLPPAGNLYVTGNATPSGWTESPPATQKLTQVSVVEYSITIALTSGQIKFLATPGKWQPQYGMLKDNPGVLGANMGSGNDPEGIDIGASGTYKITVNFKTGRYTVEKQ